MWLVSLNGPSPHLVVFGLQNMWYRSDPSVLEQFATCSTILAPTTQKLFKEEKNR